MSLRDYFAGQALTGILTDESISVDADTKPWTGSQKTNREYRQQQLRDLALDAYAIADAMLDIRASTP